MILVVRLVLILALKFAQSLVILLAFEKTLQMIQAKNVIDQRRRQGCNWFDWQTSSWLRSDPLAKRPLFLYFNQHSDEVLVPS